jgi:hypothetical protein
VEVGIVRDELLAIVSEPDQNQEPSHYELLLAAVGERVAVRRIDPARAPLGEQVSYEDICEDVRGRTRTLLGETVLDPFGVWFMPAVPWVHDGVHAHRESPGPRVLPAPRNASTTAGGVSWSRRTPLARRLWHGTARLRPTPTASVCVREALVISFDEPGTYQLPEA